MGDQSRRQFLAGMAAASTSALAGGEVFAGETNDVVRGSDPVSLGGTGVTPTVLGIGTGTRGGLEQREMGSEGITRLVRHALDRGIRYIDTADNYMMHVFLRMALKGIPRDEYFIQTKTPAKTPEVARAHIQRYRQELDTSYLDSVLMHCMTGGDWPKKMRPVLDVLLEEKEKDNIGAVGVSCHGLDALKAAVRCPDLDVNLVRINPYGQKMEGSPSETVRQMKKMRRKGRGVIGMKVFGETGYDSRDKRFRALKYVLNSTPAACFPIGFTAPGQIDETLELIEKASQKA